MLDKQLFCIILKFKYKSKRRLCCLQFPSMIFSIFCVFFYCFDLKKQNCNNIIENNKGKRLNRWNLNFAWYKRSTIVYWRSVIPIFSLFLHFICAFVSIFYSWQRNDAADMPNSLRCIKIKRKSTDIHK